MRLSSIVYSPLKEEEKQLAGWSKMTVDYALKNRSKMMQSIRGIAKSKNRQLQRADIDDIYADILYYLYSTDDYNITKAIERSNSGQMVSIEGYIHSCVKYCVIRFVTKAYDEDSKVVRDTLKQDEDSSKEISLFDTIADSKDGYSDMVFDLESICKACENERYSYGPDIFMIWFVRFQTLLLNKSDKYNDILSVLGISKREISLIQKNIEVDSLMFNIAKAATLIPMEEAASIIEKYVYGADRIKQAIETA